MPEMRRPRFPLPGAVPDTDYDDWRNRARCRAQPQLWDDSLDGKRETAEQRHKRHRQAIAECRKCPVQTQCAAEYNPARDEGVRFGQVLPSLSGRVWGRPIEHGTEAGYRTHLRRGQPIHPTDPCGCLSANRRGANERGNERLECPECGVEMTSRHLARHRRAKHQAAS